MSYPEVIQLIDVELRRLFATRDFLLAPPDADNGGRGRQSVSGVADIHAVIDAALDATADNPLPPVVKRVKAKERRATRIRKETPAEATALSGAVPHRPVYVAATQVRGEQAQRDGSDKPVVPETLTAEMLHQKWFSNSAG